ncbi:MAG: LCP family protein [Clostridia bacterium]|nr:LCP family protein [Clostridia bacterium]
MTKRTRRRIKGIVNAIVSVLLVLMLVISTAYFVIDDMLGNVEYVDPSSDDYIVSFIPEDPNESLSSEPDTDSDILASYQPIASGNIGNKLPIVSSKDKVTNVLLVGSDSRGLDFRGRTDSMMIITINETRKKIVVTSIMRDVYVYVPQVDTYNRINASYAYGGESLLMKTIKHNLGITIDRYVTVNFGIFTSFIDDIGGLDITLTADEYNYACEWIFPARIARGAMTEEDVKLYKNGGVIHANGVDTLAYSRMRYTSGGDFRRTERQRTVLMKAIEKLATLPINEIISLCEKYIGEIRTTFSKSELMNYIIKSPTYLGFEFDLGRIPVDGSWQYLNVGGRSMIGIDYAANLKYWNKRVYG